MHVKSQVEKQAKGQRAKNNTYSLDGGLPRLRLALEARNPRARRSTHGRL